MKQSVHESENLTTTEMSGVSPWHARGIEEIVTGLSSDAAQGISETEAGIRLAKDGPNLLPVTKGAGVWKLLLRQVKSIVIWVLIAAGAVSAFLGEGVDAIAIFTIVFLNALVGFYQEYGAEKSITALRKMTAPLAKVRRQDKVRSLPASEVVRGDLIEFESGDLVPADARLVDAADLRCVESALTGESEAVDKVLDAIPEANLPIGDRKNMVFMGTSVASGTGRAVVVGTGLSTEIGRIASLLHSASEEESTPLQKRLDSLGRTLVWFTLGLVVFLFLIGLWRGMEPFQLLLTAIGLAVAATPESLPAVVTVALALGVQRMAKRNALVRRLASVETLGSANVICTDKTGTLTAGEMTVKELYTAGNIFQVEGIGLDPKGGISMDGHAPDDAQTGRLRHLAAIQVGTVTASLFQEEGRWKVSGDPTEGALLTSAQKVGLVGESPPKVFSYPFDSDRKRASVIIKEKEGTFRILVNGAPDVLLGLCTRFSSPTGELPLDDKERARILEANTSMAARGLRVIGSAYREYAPQGEQKPASKDLETNLVFAGLAGMYDPPRPEARDAVAKCRKAGIRVVMITGDHPATAQAIGKDLGILEDVSGVLTGIEMATLDEAGLAERVEGTAIYARVSAEHKLRIVKAWRSRGAVVAMTGDGVNDAPAIMGAHIGIAMGRTGTEVTKQASDMVIADDNFASIVAAVEEGRGIYQNIRNTLQFLLGGNVGELMLMMVAIIAGLPAPLLAIHLLWINLVTDGLPALCLAAERIEPDIMERKPRQQAEIMSDSRFRYTLLLTGFLTAGTSLAVFLWALETRSLEDARSYAFATLVFAELLRSLGARSEFKSIWKMDLKGNINLLVVVAASIALQIFFHHNGFLGALLKTTPISLRDCLVLLGISAIPMIVLEIFKLVYPGLPRKATV
ncbi:MAG: cation-translocating P-type ATPase [Fibrobacterota bacterium]|nr:cation-translocating P-type ATPase [Fibrobacterota bacterium]